MQGPKPFYPESPNYETLKPLDNPPLFPKPQQQKKRNHKKSKQKNESETLVGGHTGCAIAKLADNPHNPQPCTEFLNS